MRRIYILNATANQQTGYTKLRRFFLDGTMERYRNGTERQRTGTERNGRALENTGQIPVKRNSI